MKYFVSYTRRDKEVTTEFLQEYFCSLKVHGNVYIDLLHNDSIDKQKRVFKELDDCDVFIIIETANVYNSKWVLIEVERAKKQQKKILRVPFGSLQNTVLMQQAIC